MRSELEALLKDEITADVLASNRTLLDELTPEEKIDMASRMVLSIQGESLRTFHHVKEALRHPKTTRESFYDVISQALEVRQRLASLLDERNHAPHNQLLSPEFCGDMYRKFALLSRALITDSAQQIAERLSTTTPKERQSELARNVNLAFGERSTFAMQINQSLAKDLTPSPARWGLFRRPDDKKDSINNHSPTLHRSQSAFF